MWKSWVGLGGIGCVLILCWPEGSQTPRQDGTGAAARVHEYLAARNANGEFSGTVAVQRHAETIYKESFGFADFENRVAFTDHSRFEVASITKTFTAAAIALLLNEGKLTLNSTLDLFFPKFPRAHEITVRHLLSHSSGLGELPPGPWIKQEHSVQEVVEEIGKRPFLFAPGRSERYSNSGFVLLAALVERVSGKSYDGFLRERVFGPLGMTETGNFSPVEIVPERVHKYAPGPAPELVWNVAPEDLSYSRGAGSASSTAHDLLLWLRASGKHALFTRPAGEYPYGWGRQTYFGRAGINQTGLHAGASAAILTFPGEELHVVCLSNIESGFFSSCAKDVAGIVLGESVGLPEIRKDAGLSREKLGCFEGDFRANGRLAFRLKVNGSFLVFSWLDDPRDSFVRTLDEHSLFLPSQSADLRAEAQDSDCKVNGIRWKNSFDELHFAREKAR